MSFAREWAREFVLLWLTVGKYAAALICAWLLLVLLTLYTLLPSFAWYYIEHGTLLNQTEPLPQLHWVAVVVWVVLNGPAAIALYRATAENEEVDT